MQQIIKYKATTISKTLFPFYHNKIEKKVYKTADLQTSLTLRTLQC